MRPHRMATPEQQEQPSEPAAAPPEDMDAAAGERANAEAGESQAGLPSPMATVTIDVWRISGEHILQLTLGQDTTPSAVMEELVTVTGVPVKYQQLMHGGQILPPTPSLADQGLCDGATDEPLQLHLVAQAPSPAELDILQQGTEDECLLRYLVRARADLAKENEAGDFPLWQAVGAKKLERLQVLLNVRADPEQASLSGGEPVLLHAASTGNPAAVRMLLQARADPMRPYERRSGSFPLLMAIRNHWSDLTEYTECLVTLLQGRADPCQVNPRNGEFPLLCTAKNNRGDCMRVLLEWRADPLQAEEATGAFPLLLAAGSHYTEWPGHSECLNILLEARADPNQTNAKNGDFPLLVAAGNWRSDCLRALLAARADPHKVNEKTGATVLQRVRDNSRRDCMRAWKELVPEAPSSEHPG